MAVIKITKENFEAEVINSEKTVLLDFYADWCMPCKMLGPVVEEISDDRSDITVGKINVDLEPELAAAFSVSSIPMLAVMKNGELVNKMIGFSSKDKILEML